ncbi:MAG: hypothetical protein R3B46_10095 [Phycisphaerales bacterium]
MKLMVGIGGTREGRTASKITMSASMVDAASYSVAATARGRAPTMASIASTGKPGRGGLRRHQAGRARYRAAPGDSEHHPRGVVGGERIARDEAGSKPPAERSLE